MLGVFTTAPQTVGVPVFIDHLGADLGSECGAIFERLG
jgi:hypothetical protein